ncbi:helix-turn-helix domain-containing protein [Paenibacillus sp. sptzw28]|nr:helix-turn-helix domain-containing protein [Paenibacillus sp. sptzw28]
MRLRIKEYNTARPLKDHITQRKIAKELGVSESFIAMVANNERELSYERAANVALLLGCDMKDLHEWHEVPTSKSSKRPE